MPDMKEPILPRIGREGSSAGYPGRTWRRPKGPVSLSWDCDNKGMVIVLTSVQQFDALSTAGVSHYDYEINLSAEHVPDLLKALSGGVDVIAQEGGREVVPLLLRLAADLLEAAASK